MKPRSPLTYLLTPVKVGRVDLKAMKSAGVTVPQIINYYTYMTEYMWNVISPEPEVHTRSRTLTSMTSFTLSTQNIGNFKLYRRPHQNIHLIFLFDNINNDSSAGY